MQGLKLGTRGSPLALAQARKVASAIESAQRWPDGYVEIVPVTTSGDQMLDRPLGEIDATLLAAAGLKRLGIAEGTAIPTEILLPAPGQAAIGMECRTDDTMTQ